MIIPDTFTFSFFIFCCFSSNMSDSDSELDSGEEWNHKGSKKRKGSSKKNFYQRMAFNEEEEEKLIEFIKTQPCIYDVSSHQYKDRVLKHKSWEEIAKNMSKKVDDCKKKWKNIKDYYDRSKKKMPTGSGTNPNQAKRMELLSFLDSFSTVNNKYGVSFFLSSISLNISNVMIFVFKVQSQIWME